MIPEEIVETLDKRGFDIGSVIGRGGYSVCLSVYSRQYKENFVCKILQLCDLKGDAKRKSFQNEADALTKVIHKNIIQVFSTFSTKNYMFLILELCAAGDLNKYVKIHGPITNTVKLLTILSKVLDALVYLEENNIAHKDIKPSNIFIDKYGRPKIADFGLAIYFDEGELCNSFTGTPIFIAPEVISLRPHSSFKADVWSLGITIVYLATGTYPYILGNSQELRKCIKCGLYDIPKTMDPTVQEIVRNCLIYNPDERKSFAQLRAQVKTELDRRSKIHPEICKPMTLVQSRNTTIKRFSNVMFNRTRSSNALLTYHRNVLHKI